MSSSSIGGGGGSKVSKRRSVREQIVTLENFDEHAPSVRFTEPESQEALEAVGIVAADLLLSSVKRRVAEARRGGLKDELVFKLEQTLEDRRVQFLDQARDKRRDVLATKQHIKDTMAFASADPGSALARSLEAKRVERRRRVERERQQFLATIGRRGAAGAEAEGGSTSGTEASSSGSRKKKSGRNKRAPAAPTDGVLSLRSEISSVLAKSQNQLMREHAHHSKMLQNAVSHHLRTQYKVEKYMEHQRMEAERYEQLQEEKRARVREWHMQRQQERIDAKRILKEETQRQRTVRAFEIRALEASQLEQKLRDAEVRMVSAPWYEIRRFDVAGMQRELALYEARLRRELSNVDPISITGGVRKRLKRLWVLKDHADKTVERREKEYLERRAKVAQHKDDIQADIEQRLEQRIANFERAQQARAAREAEDRQTREKKRQEMEARRREAKKAADTALEEKRSVIESRLQKAEDNLRLRKEQEKKDQQEKARLQAEREAERKAVRDRHEENVQQRVEKIKRKWRTVDKRQRQAKEQRDEELKSTTVYRNLLRAERLAQVERVEHQREYNADKLKARIDLDLKRAEVLKAKQRQIDEERRKHRAAFTAEKKAARDLIEKLQGLRGVEVEQMEQLTNDSYTSLAELRRALLPLLRKKQKLGTAAAAEAAKYGGVSAAFLARNYPKFAERDKDQRSAATVERKPKPVFMRSELDRRQTFSHVRSLAVYNRRLPKYCTLESLEGFTKDLPEDLRRWIYQYSKHRIASEMQLMQRLKHQRLIRRKKKESENADKRKKKSRRRRRKKVVRRLVVPQSPRREDGATVHHAPQGSVGIPEYTYSYEDESESDDMKLFKVLREYKKLYKGDEDDQYSYITEKHLGTNERSGKDRDSNAIHKPMDAAARYVSLENALKWVYDPDVVVPGDESVSSGSEAEDMSNAARRRRNRSSLHLRTIGNIKGSPRNYHMKASPRYQSKRASAARSSAGAFWEQPRAPKTDIAAVFDLAKIRMISDEVEAKRKKQETAFRRSRSRALMASISRSPVTPAFIDDRHKLTEDQNPKDGITYRLLAQAAQRIQPSSPAGKRSTGGAPRTPSSRSKRSSIKVSGEDGQVFLTGTPTAKRTPSSRSRRVSATDGHDHEETLVVPVAPVIQGGHARKVSAEVLAEHSNPALLRALNRYKRYGSSSVSASTVAAAKVDSPARHTRNPSRRHTKSESISPSAKPVANASPQAPIDTDPVAPAVPPEE